MTHKDLSSEEREYVEATGTILARDLRRSGQSLALAREAWINAFDRAAEAMEAEDGKTEA